MRKLKLASYAGAAACSLVLFGCATQSSRSSSDYRIEPPQTRLDVNAPLESKALSSLEACVIEALRPTVASSKVRDGIVYVSFFDNETASPAMPSKMQTVAVNGLATLGLRPIDARTMVPQGSYENLVRTSGGKLLLVSGSLTGFVPLLNAERDVKNIGVGGGGASGLWSFQAGNRWERSVGAVTAMANIAEVGLGVYAPRTIAAGRATSDFTMITDGYTLAGSVAIGIGGGVARETSRLVGAQQSAEFATRAAILAAVADYYNLSSAGRSCWQHK